MGLRVGTNVGAVNALRNLQRVDRSQQAGLERLSSGQRILRASDDPSGLVISNQLRATLSGLTQAVENASRDRNLLRTADAALGGTTEILQGIRQDVVAALNSGGLGGGALSALQGAVDRAVGAVDRIAGTTRFGTADLLNGAADFNITQRDAALTQVDVQAARLQGNGPQDFTVQVTQQAARADTGVAGLGVIGAAQAAGGTIRVTGNLGNEEITFQAGATRAQVAAAINQAAGNTGVQADAATGAVQSEGLGAAQLARIEVVQGGFTGPVGQANGVDVAGTIAGQTAAGTGDVLRTAGAALTAEVRVDAAAGAGGFNFRVEGGGLPFQLGPAAGVDALRVGIQGAASSGLGNPDTGFLSQVTTGGSADLATDPQQALRIVDAALARVNGQRAAIGATEGFNLGPGLEALEVQVENLTASESRIRDLDFAEESARGARDQVLRQATLAVLRQANLSQQGALALLAPR
ncbi:MAG: hypothetical protein HY722_15880 [Planctomycetes bacterium]|nr:hypothetical protein [Planctomycetota bacterium]